MYYHSFLLLPNGGCTITLNKTDSDILSKIVKPYIHSEITLESYDELGGGILFNHSMGIMLSLYKSEKKINNYFKTYDANQFIENIKLENDIVQCTHELIDNSRLNRVGDNSFNLQYLFPTIQNQVFVVMKFGDKFLNSAYEGAIKPTIENFDLIPVRIDEIENSGIISEQILKSISESKYVLIDLSGERPNCYYEAGFAHALNKELILTIRKEDKIHFDLSGYRFFQWETESELREF